MFEANFVLATLAASDQATQNKSQKVKSKQTNHSVNNSTLCNNSSSNIEQLRGNSSVLRDSERIVEHSSNFDIRKGNNLYKRLISAINIILQLFNLYILVFIYFSSFLSDEYSIFFGINLIK